MNRDNRLTTYMCKMKLIILLVVAMTSSVTSVVSAETLTLERSLEIAMTNSPTIRNTVLSLEISERNLAAQNASLKSRFDLTITPFQWTRDRLFNDLVSSYVTQELKFSLARFSIEQPLKWTDGTFTLSESVDWRESSSSFTGSNNETNYSNTLQLSFSQPLFTYNRTMLQLEELQLSLENAQLNYSLQKLQIELEVTRQFLDLYHSRMSVEISEEEQSNSKESYEIIKSKVEAGIVAREELFQADLSQANSQASLDNSRIQYANGLDDFIILLGLSLNDSIDIAADIRKAIVAVDPVLAEEHGLKTRMELRQKEISIQNSLFNLTRTGAQNEFRGTVNLSWGVTGTDKSFSGIYDSPNRNQSVGITFNIPLFDWGEKKQRLAAAEAQVETQRISASEQEKQVIRGIRQSYRNLRNQENQIGIAEKNVKNARLTYEINLERYRNGDLSSKDISFYLEQLSREQLNEVAALINYQIALLDMKIRSLWDFETNRSVIDTQ